MSMPQIAPFSNDNNNLFVNKNEECEKNMFLKIFKTTRDKIPLTLLYCMVFWNFGICVAIFGPTLLDLACQTGSSLAALSWLYFIQNLTSLIGCFLSGIVLRHGKISVNILLLICTTMLPLCVAMMPVAESVFFLGLIMALLGINMGFIDNLGNLSILKLHGNNVSPFIQGLHFFYGLGAFVTPIVVQLFLNSTFDTSSAFNCYSEEDVEEYMKLQGISVTSNQTFISAIPAEILIKKYNAKSKTKYAFWILAFLQLPVPMCLFLFKIGKIFKNFDLELIDEKILVGNHMSYSDIDGNGIGFNEKSFLNIVKEKYENCCIYIKNSIPLLKMTTLVALLVFIFDGLQATHGGFIFSYAVEKYDLVDITTTKMNKTSHSTKFNHKRSDDAYITASFWAFFSLGRLISIFVATKLTPKFMVLIDLVGCLFSTLLMLLSALINSKNKFLIYLSTCLFGLFLSNTTPCSYSLAEMNIGMTPTLTSFIIISAASGEMLLPILVGNLFEIEGPTSFLVVELIVTVISCFVFMKFLSLCKSYASNQNMSFMWIAEHNAQTDLSCGIDFDSPSRKKFSEEKSNLVGHSSVKYYSQMQNENEESEN